MNVCEGASEESSPTGETIRLGSLSSSCRDVTSQQIAGILVGMSLAKTHSRLEHGQDS
jgi:hypothetical protein